MNSFKRLILLLAIVATTFMLTACKEETKPDFSSYQSVAEATIYKATLHNVAVINDEGFELFGLVNFTSKTAWFEYDANVRLGVDVRKINISEPNIFGTVIITIPEVEVLDYDIIEESISDLYDDSGLLVSITTDDQAKAVDRAKNDGINGILNESELIAKVEESTKETFRKYVENVGEATGKNYEVKFKDAE